MTSELALLKRLGITKAPHALKQRRDFELHVGYLLHNQHGDAGRLELRNGSDSAHFIPRVGIYGNMMSSITES